MAGPIDIQHNFGPRTIVGAICDLMPDPRGLPLGTCFVEEGTGKPRYVVRDLTLGPNYGNHIWMPVCNT